MAIFWTSWLVAANMTSFAMMLHNRFQAAERMHKTSCLCVYKKQLQLFLGSYFCQLNFSPFTADQDASKLSVLVCSPFDCSCASTRSHPLPLGKFLAVVCSRLLQSSGSASFTYFVSLLSVLLRLSCTLIRRHFVSLEHFLAGSAPPFTLRCCLILSLFVLYPYYIIMCTWSTLLCGSDQYFAQFLG